jgi:hypothetical protein
MGGAGTRTIARSGSTRTSKAANIFRVITSTTFFCLVPLSIQNLFPLTFPPCPQDIGGASDI